MALTQARRIDHVAIAVLDADLAIESLQHLFGLTLSTDAHSADGRVRLVYLEAGDTTIQLVQPLTAGPVERWISEHGEGLHHVCIDVPDLGAALFSLPGNSGVEVAIGGRGCPVAFLRDPVHGAIVELTDTRVSSKGANPNPSVPG